MNQSVAKEGDVKAGLANHTKARMPTIKRLVARTAIFLALHGAALGADNRQDRDAPHGHALPPARGDQQRGTSVRDRNAVEFDQPVDRDAEATFEDNKTASKPRSQRGQPLPVRFEPSTRRAKSQVVRASALEPVDSDRPAKLAPPQDEKSLALAPPTSGASKSARTPGSIQSLVTLGGSLAVVVGLFLLVAWVMRRGMPKSASLLPREALEVLGRAPLAGKHQVHLLRCGNKLLLVNVTATGAETLTEITDPLEVDRLSGICLQSRRGSSSKAFQSVLSQFEQEPTLPSFVGEPTRTRLDLSSFESIGKGKRREGLHG